MPKASIVYTHTPDLNSPLPSPSHCPLSRTRTPEQPRMSTFGSPGGRQIISKPNPPERGSFPLDHEAECQPIMKQYLRCLRSHRGINDDECRQLSKGYLQCRMDRYDYPLLLLLSEYSGVAGIPEEILLT